MELFEEDSFFHENIEISHAKKRSSLEKDGENSQNLNHTKGSPKLRDFLKISCFLL
jgi:hypothetical protein